MWSLRNTKSGLKIYIIKEGVTKPRRLLKALFLKMLGKLHRFYLNI